jgi:hypothetical protein
MGLYECRLNPKFMGRGPRVTVIVFSVVINCDYDVNKMYLSFTPSLCGPSNCQIDKQGTPLALIMGTFSRFHGELECPRILGIFDLSRCSLRTKLNI